MPVTRIHHEGLPTRARQPKSRVKGAEHVKKIVAPAAAPAPVAAPPVETAVAPKEAPMTREAQEISAEAPPTTVPPEETPVGETARGSGMTGNYPARIDAVRSRLNGQRQEDGQWQGLLDQAVTLLETVAAHPAMVDYAEVKQRLETVEQRLSASGNVG